MVKAADFRDLDHPPPLWRLHGTRLRRILVQRQVRPCSVIVVHVVPHNSPQVRFPEYDGLDCRLQPIPQMSNAFGSSTRFILFRDGFLSALHQNSGGEESASS